jgi:hypothetical protein
MELTLSHCEQQLAASEALTEAYSGHAARHVWFNHALASQLGSAAGAWMPRPAIATVSHANTMLELSIKALQIRRLVQPLK